MALKNAHIAIVHGATTSFSRLTDVTFPNHAEYALKHGYVLRNIELKPSEGVWGKIRALQETLENPSIQRVFWIDADAIFTNLELSLSEHLPNEKIVLACDAIGANFGIIWLENCLEVRRLLETIASKGFELFKNRAWEEQSAFRYFTFHPPYDKMVQYVEQTRMNSFMQQVYSNENWTIRRPDTFGQWQPGHFILHLVALPHSTRIAILEKILPLIKK